tara:strand:- start:370 stop:1134 length:765 start_codon:yes stop_codon:yes gene_type:complete
MKVIILAGGLGTRLSEETQIKPKPMVEIGGYPILWHIMNHYSKFGYIDFVILLGYKGYIIKEYFVNYFLHNSDFTVDLGNNNVEIINKQNLNWKVTLVDTGINSMTGARVKKVEHLVGNNTFMLTYGDGLIDLNINELVKFHRKHEAAVTMTSAQPDGRFGALDIKGNKVVKFQEKPKGDGSWINAGYFVCDKDLFKYIEDGDDVVLEQKPLKLLAKDNQLFTYKHEGFWMPMDTLRDKIKLEKIWKEKNAPWK